MPCRSSRRLRLIDFPDAFAEASHRLVGFQGKVDSEFTPAPETCTRGGDAATMTFDETAYQRESDA